MPSPLSAGPSRLVKVVYFGDSITYGQHVDQRLRWTTLVAERLDSVYRRTAVNVLHLNRGVSGETTRQALERFPADAQQHRPDVLTIQFGLNDCNCWLTDGGASRVSPTAFRANIQEMISRARLFSVRHIILANNHPTLRDKLMLSGEAYEAANAHYSEITRDVAIESGVTYCDVRARFASFSPNQLEQLLLPYPDQLHLSVAGNQVYADTICPLVEAGVSSVVSAALEDI